MGDEACPHANKDTRWSMGYISYKACKDETYQQETVSSCDFSKACDCTGSNKGIYASHLKVLGADYGKQCLAHDSDCKAKWGPSGMSLDKGIWNDTSAATWCCESWCYVPPECPLAETSWTGSDLYWSVVTCDNDPKLKYKAASGKCESSTRLLRGVAEFDVAVQQVEEEEAEEAEQEEEEKEEESDKQEKQEDDEEEEDRA